MRFSAIVSIHGSVGELHVGSNQFFIIRFLNGGDEAFSTEPLKNENQDLALGFYHMQNVSVAYHDVMIASYIANEFNVFSHTDW